MKNIKNHEIVHVSNLSFLIKKIDDLTLKLDNLAQESDVVHTKISLLTGAPVYSDTLPVPNIDPNRGGWLYSKTVDNSDKFNYYFYNNNSLSPMLVSELKNFWAVVTVYNFVNAQSIPFMVLYTLPTGVDDQEVWYKSKIAYSINLTDKKLYSGEKILVYMGEKPIYHTKLRSFKLDIKTITGNGLNTETINLLSVHCDSLVPLGYTCGVQNVGWSNNNVKFNIELK